MCRLAERISEAETLVAQWKLLTSCSRFNANQIESVNCGAPTMPYRAQKRIDFGSWIIARRVARAAFDVATSVSPRRRKELLSKAHDIDVLVGALQDRVLVRALQRDTRDPLILAKMRGIARQEEMIKEAGGVLTTSEAAEALGVTRQAVDKRIRTGSMLALTVGSNSAIPAFQIRGRSTLPGLAKVLRAMQIKSPWMRLNFFLMKHDSLSGRRPIEALSEGDIDAVVQATAGFGEHGSP